MKKNYFTLERLNKILIVFFTYVLFAPAVRVLLVGGDTTQNFYEFVITAIPDFLFIFIVFFSVKIYIEKGKLRLFLYDWVVIAFAVSNVILGFLLSGDFFISLRGIRITYPPILFYFIGRLYFIDERLSHSMLKKIFYCIFYFGVAGLVLHFGFRDFERYMIKLSGNIQSTYFMPRMGSFILTPVIFSTVMALSCLYFYYLVLKEGKWFYYLTIAIIWTCIFLSVSRGPIIGFLLSFVFMTILFKQWKRSLGVFLILFVISSMISYMVEDSFAIMGWLFSSTSDTLGMGEKVTRVNFWKESLENFKDKPAGYGSGKAGYVAHRFFSGDVKKAAVYTTDGWYLKLACETGIYGLISYLSMCALYVYYSFMFLKVKPAGIFTFFFAIFLLVNAQNIVGNVLDFYPYNTLFWLIAGFSVNMIKQRNESISNS